MRSEYRDFTLQEIGLTLPQLECIYIHFRGYRFTRFTELNLIRFYWTLDSKGVRTVKTTVDKLDLNFTVANTTLLSTMEDFQNAFQENPPLNRPKLINKLALYDIRREMRWAITAYHQSKISEVAGW